MPHLDLQHCSLAGAGRVWPMTYVLKRSAGGHAARYVAGRAPALLGSTVPTRPSQALCAVAVSCRSGLWAARRISALCFHCWLCEVVSILCVLLAQPWTLWHWCLSFFQLKVIKDQQACSTAACEGFCLTQHAHKEMTRLPVRAALAPGCAPGASRTATRSGRRCMAATPASCAPR